MPLCAHWALLGALFRSYELPSPCRIDDHISCLFAFGVHEFEHDQTRRPCQQHKQHAKTDGPKHHAQSRAGSNGGHCWSREVRVSKRATNRSIG